MTTRKLDEIDRKLVAALQVDPQATNTAVARKLNVSELTVANRIESLVADKMMKVTVQRDIRTLGYALVGFVDVHVRGAPVRDVAEQIGSLPDVYSVSLFADHPQIVVILLARDVGHWLSLVEGEIGSISGVQKTSISLCLDVLSLRPGIAAL